MKVCLEETIVVGRNIADCYRYVMDFSTVEQWDPGVYRSEKLTPGPVRVGTQFDLLLNVAGSRVPMRYTLTETVDRLSLTLQGEGDTIKALDRITFKAVGEHATEIHYQADLTLDSVPDSAKVVFMPFMKRLGRKAVEGLKTALTIPLQSRSRGLKSTLKDRLVVPAMLDFTESGYLKMPHKGLSQFMDGKTVLVTGATAGLGLAAACELSRLGATVLMLGRDEAKLAAARQRVLDFSGVQPEQVVSFEADLSLISEVRKVARKILKQHPALDVLINNAGALFNERTETAEGNESSLAINLLAPYELTLALMPALEKRRGRVINVASGGVYLSGLDLEDIQYSRRSYNGAKAYAQAKRALVAISAHWAKQHADSGVEFHCMHPGWAATPGVEKSLPAFNQALNKRLRDSRMGADTMVWLASASEVAGQSGHFWFDREPHVSEVLPGTGVNARQLEALLDWLGGERTVQPLTA